MRHIAYTTKTHAPATHRIAGVFVWGNPTYQMNLISDASRMCRQYVMTP